MLIPFVAVFGLLLLSLIVSLENTENDSFYFNFHQKDYDVAMELTEAVRFTQPEVKDFKVRIFKYNRTTPALNITMAFNIDVGKELEIIIQLRKFLSNEYRLFPLRCEVNFCKSIERDLFGVAQFMKCGNFTGCPFRKGRTYHICNWTPDQSRFPPFIPTGRYMAEIEGSYRNKELFALHVHAAASRNIVKK